MCSSDLSNQLAQLQGLEDAEVRLTLTPSDAQGVIVEADVLAGKVQLTQPYALTASRVNVSTRFPVGGASVAKVQLAVQAEQLLLADGTTIAFPRGRIRGTAKLTPGAWNYTPEEFEAAAQSVTTELLSQPLGCTYALSRSLTPRLSGTLSTELAGTAVFADVSVDLAEKSAEAELNSWVGPAILKPVSDALGRDLSRWVSVTRPVALAGRVRFDPGWKLASATAWVDGEGVTAYGVSLDEARGRVTLEGTKLAATDVVLRTGPSRAAGTYTMDTANLDFRFLLEGRLMPAAISTWFRSGWWDRLFSHFDFTAAAPAANVDVTGRWGLPDWTTVFVSVLADRPAIESVPLDRVQTVVFVRSLYYEARELAVRHRGGSGSGTFSHWSDPVTRQSSRLDFQGDTVGLDPAELLAMLGDTGRRITSPFRFRDAPELKVQGRLDYEPGAVAVHPDIHVQGSSPGVVELYEFPVSNLRFTAEVKDDAITVVPEVDFGGGKGTGKVWLTGRDGQQTLRFDYALKNAKLGPLAEAIEDYSARRSGNTRAEKSAYMAKASDVTVNLTLAAEGPAANRYGLKGRGQADLEGAKLGDVPLLGPLSELIPVLTLRFTRMQAGFELDGPALRLPDAKMAGANSGIEARGVYNLQTGILDFNARVAPFSESSNPLQALANLLTQPLSDILQVHLSGTLRKPAWALALGGTRDPLQTNASANGGSAPVSTAPTGSP